ncbi:MAG: glycosyl hydrolase family 8 [Nitrospirae bacterium]|nr:glycosyl hydrolase family 8 [Nitrospirota bacterium]
MAGKSPSSGRKQRLALLMVPWIVGLLLGGPPHALAASGFPHGLSGTASGNTFSSRTDRDRSTSEGEAYALFFSLVAGDRDTFRKILEWTGNNLAQGDLDRHLPAWVWRKRPNGRWGILDVNPASDADCWIAYTLIEAGRLWKDPAYERQGRHLLSTIEKNETAFLPGYGWALLPGPWGFRLPDGTTRLNPSYFPPEILLDLENVSPHSPLESDPGHHHLRVC